MYGFYFNFVILTPYMRKSISDTERSFLPGMAYKLYFLTSWNQVSRDGEDITIVGVGDVGIPSTFIRERRV